MKNKANLGIFGILLAMVVGYAAINVVLNIRANTILGYNEDDFRVYISRLMLDGKNISENISAQGDSFSFVAPSGSNTITYRVINESTQYDANVNLTCTSGNATLEIEQIGLIAAKTIETRDIKITNANNDLITCTLNIEQVSKTEIASSCCSNASTVSFTPKNPDWNVKTVEEALNFLREKTKQ